MAQLIPCPAHLSPLAVDWFDTGGDPIGTFRFRGGREAPTTCGLILDLPGGRRFIPARPPGFAAAPWGMEARFEWLTDLAWSARRALIGQTPRHLELLIVALDLQAHLRRCERCSTSRPPPGRGGDRPGRSGGDGRFLWLLRGAGGDADGIAGGGHPAARNGGLSPRGRALI